MPDSPSARIVIYLCAVDARSPRSTRTWSSCSSPPLLAGFRSCHYTSSRSIPQVTGYDPLCAHLVCMATTRTNLSTIFKEKSQLWNIVCFRVPSRNTNQGAVYATPMGRHLFYFPSFYRWFAHQDFIGQLSRANTTLPKQSRDNNVRANAPEACSASSLLRVDIVKVAHEPCTIFRWCLVEVET